MLQVRADFKRRVSRFDVRNLLTYPKVIEAVSRRIDLASVEAHLASPHAAGMRLRTADGKRRDEGNAADEHEVADALREVGLTAYAVAAAAEEDAATAAAADGTELSSVVVASGKSPSSRTSNRASSSSPRLSSPRGTPSSPNKATPKGGPLKSPSLGGGAGAATCWAEPPSDMSGGGLSRVVQPSSASPSAITGKRGERSRSTDPLAGASGDGGGGAVGSAVPSSMLTYDDARFVSQSATAFIVWLSRVTRTVSRLVIEWHEATAACKHAEMRIDGARHHVESIRAKVTAIERDEVDHAEDEAEVRYPLLSAFNPAVHTPLSPQRLAQNPMACKCSPSLAPSLGAILCLSRVYTARQEAPPAQEDDTQPAHRADHHRSPPHPRPRQTQPLLPARRDDIGPCQPAHSSALCDGSPAGDHLLPSSQAC